MTTEFKPFQNDSQSTTLGSEDEGFTIENGFEQIAVHGDATFRKGNAQDAKRLASFIEILTAIQAQMAPAPAPNAKKPN